MGGVLAFFTRHGVTVERATPFSSSKSAMLPRFDGYDKHPRKSSTTFLAPTTSGRCLELSPIREMSWMERRAASARCGRLKAAEHRPGRVWLNRVASGRELPERFRYSCPELMDCAVARVGQGSFPDWFQPDELARVFNPEDL